MALNDRDPILRGAKAADAHPGVANPTSFGGEGNPIAANFVDDPTTEDKGAGAGANFQGGAQAARSLRQTSGIKESSGSGIIETTHIDPLNDNATQTPGSGNRGTGVGQKAYDAANTASEMAGGATMGAYGTATGDQAAKKVGKDAIYG